MNLVCGAKPHTSEALLFNLKCCVMVVASNMVVPSAVASPSKANSMLWLHVVSRRSVALTLCGHSIEVALSVLRLLIGAALFFFIPSFILTVLLFPRTQDLFGLERALIAVITSFSS